MKNDGTVFTLENEELLITVDRHGAELTRIYDKRPAESFSGEQIRQSGIAMRLYFSVCRKEL